MEGVRLVHAEARRVFAASAREAAAEFGEGFVAAVRRLESGEWLVAGIGEDVLRRLRGEGWGEVRPAAFAAVPPGEEFPQLLAWEVDGERGWVLWGEDGEVLAAGPERGEGRRLQVVVEEAWGVSVVEVFHSPPGAFAFGSGVEVEVVVPGEEFLLPEEQREREERRSAKVWRSFAVVGLACLVAAGGAVWSGWRELRGLESRRGRVLGELGRVERVLGRLRKETLASRLPRPGAGFPGALRVMEEGLPPGWGVKAGWRPGEGWRGEVFPGKGSPGRWEVEAVERTAVRAGLLAVPSGEGFDVRDVRERKR